MRSSMMIAMALVLGACGSSAASTSAAEPATSSGAESTPQSIVATAQGAGQFNTLVAAIQAAGLVETLQGAGPFTVFAPTDAAFAALPAGTLDSLLLPENQAQLRSILTYHVVAGDVRAAQVVGMTTAPTVQGQAIAISLEGGTVRLNGAASVTTADIACSNGVIHVIDAVILPPAQ